MDIRKSISKDIRDYNNNHNKQKHIKGRLQSISLYNTQDFNTNNEGKEKSIKSSQMVSIKENSSPSRQSGIRGYKNELENASFVNFEKALMKVINKEMMYEDSIDMISTGFLSDLRNNNQVYTETAMIVDTDSLYNKYTDVHTNILLGRDKFNVAVLSTSRGESEYHTTISIKHYVSARYTHNIMNYMKDRSYLSYVLSPDTRFLFVIYKEHMELLNCDKKFFVIYSFPSMDEVGEIEMTDTMRNSEEIFDMYFTYEYSHNDEIELEYIVIPTSSGLFTVDLRPWDWKSNRNFVVIDMTPYNVYELGEIFIKLNKGDMFITEQHSEEDYTTKSLKVWRWSPYNRQKIVRLTRIQLVVQKNLTVIPDSVSVDHSYVYGFMKEGKEIAKINILTSKVRYIFQFNYEDKRMLDAKVINDGNFILTVDSTYSLLVYNMNINRGYDLLACFDFSDPITAINISHNHENIYIMKSKGELVTIPMYLTQHTRHEYIRCSSSIDNYKILDFKIRSSKSVVVMYDRDTKYLIKMSKEADKQRFVDVQTTELVDFQYAGTHVSYDGRYRLYWKDKGVLYVDVDRAVGRIECEREVVRAYIQVDSSVYYLCIVYSGGCDVYRVSDKGHTHVFNHDVPDRHIYYISSELIYIYKHGVEVEQIEVFGIDDKSTVYIGVGIYPLKVTSRNECDVVAVISENELLLISKDLNTTATHKLPRVNDVECEISYDGLVLVILDKKNRVMVVFIIDIEKVSMIDSSFEIHHQLVPIRYFCFTKDSKYLLVMDSSLEIRIYCVSVKQQISSINLNRYVMNNWSLEHFCVSHKSKDIVCVFKSSRTTNTSGSSDGLHVVKVPFYRTKHNPFNTYLLSNIQTYLTHQTYTKKDIITKTIITKFHTLEHYQVAINSIYTSLIFMLDHPELLEKFTEGYLDFNLVSKMCLPLLQDNFNRIESLRSFIKMFTSYSKDIGECPYIDQRILMRLIYSEGIQIQNRYSRQLLSKILFAPVKTIFGELKNPEENVVVLSSDNNDIETEANRLMVKDATNLNSYTCCISKIPLDLSNGSDFSIGFFSNINKFSDEEIREKYKVFIYYKWNKIFYFALSYAVLYWCLNILVYLYMGGFVANRVFAYVLISLNMIFILFEVKCMVVDMKRYFSDKWNSIDWFNHVLSIITTIVLSYDIEHQNSRIYIHWLRWLTSLLISLRGITMLRVFKQTRYIITMILEVAFEVYPFMVVLVYVILIMTLVWMIEPQLENPSLQSLSFYDAIERLVNTAFGNFYTSEENGQQINFLKFIILIIINVVLGLVFLNFLIALISSTYEKIAEKKDLYDVREILPLIQDFDQFFKSCLKKKIEKKKRGSAAKNLDYSYKKRSGRGDIYKQVDNIKNHIDKKKDNDIDLLIDSNKNKKHFLCLIPEIEEMDPIRQIKKRLEIENKELKVKIDISEDNIISRTLDVKLKMKELEERIALMDNKFDTAFNEIKCFITGEPHGQKSLDLVAQFMHQRVNNKQFTSKDTHDSSKQKNRKSVKISPFSEFLQKKRNNEMVKEDQVSSESVNDGPAPLKPLVEVPTKPLQPVEDEDSIDFPVFNPEGSATKTKKSKSKPEGELK